MSLSHIHICLCAFSLLEETWVATLSKAGLFSLHPIYNKLPWQARPSKVPTVSPVEEVKKGKGIYGIVVPLFTV
jgi:hypothetical protein